LKLAGVDPKVFLGWREVTFPIEHHRGFVILEGDGVNAAGERSGFGLDDGKA